MKVTVDYGHGGKSSGAVSNGVMEKDLNLQLGELLKERLERCGVEVHLTRRNDETVDLGKRIMMINNEKSDYVISIHHNAGGGEGAEIIHSIREGKSKQLASAIEKYLSRVQKFRKIYSRKSSNTGDDYYGVIRETNPPSIIVEVGFIDNDADFKRITNQEFKVKAAEAIAAGLLEHAGIKCSDTKESGKDNTSPGTDIDGKIYRVEVVHSGI